VEILAHPKIIHNPESRATLLADRGLFADIQRDGRDRMARLDPEASEPHAFSCW
jgi:hypothetical protein